MRQMRVAVVHDMVQLEIAIHVPQPSRVVHESAEEAVCVEPKSAALEQWNAAGSSRHWWTNARYPKD